MNRPVKVLHITFDMTIGGAQQVIRQLVENMDPTRVESEIVCIDGRLGEIGEMLQEQGVNIHLLDRQPGFDLQLIKNIYKIIKAGSFDIVHCHQYTPYVYGLLASIFTSANVIFTEHGRFYPDYGTWKRKLVNPFFSLFTDKITAISEATKQALVKYENFKADKIEVIYNGIKDHSDIEVDEKALKKQFGIPPDAFIFGTISRLQPIKNQTMMIKAFKQVHDEHENTHLLIVGDGEMRATLEKLTKDLQLSEAVTFTGFQKDPYPFHKIIDVFLLTSFSEGTSMTLLEAMSFSTPCIVTDVGGNPEIITDKVNGVLVESDGEIRLIEACCSLIESHQKIINMQIQSRKIFLNKYHISIMMSQFINIYVRPSMKKNNKNH